MPCSAPISSRGFVPSLSTRIRSRAGLRPLSPKSAPTMSPFTSGLWATANWCSIRRGDLMATIGFIGLGNMGGPMAANLLKAGHKVIGYDVVATPVGNLELQGGKGAASAAEAAMAGDIVVTMLPAGPQVRSVYLGP